MIKDNDLSPPKKVRKHMVQKHQLHWKIIFLLSVLWSACDKEKKNSATRTPNIVLINVDDLGWADLACYGNEFHETPNIDRLASQGMLFTNAYASAAICSPTRAALMTGKSPAKLGLTDYIRPMFRGSHIPADKTYRLTYVGGQNDSLLTPSNPLWLELEEVTIAERLKELNYAIVHIGKWHLGDEDWYPEKQGFDSNIAGCDYGQPPSYFDPYKNNKLSGIPTLSPRKEGEYLTDRLGDEAVHFIKDHKEKPFFINMNPYAVHTPIQGRPDLVAKYEKKAHPDQNNPSYAAMVESVDMLVGKIMHALDSLDLSENTVLIFTSDNGGLERVTDNTPLRSGKGYAYEGGIRVPLIVRFPGKIAKGSRNDVPVISHDLFPTICDIVNLDVSESSQVDGVSIKPILYQGDQPEREALYWHFPHYRVGGVVPYSIIRRGDWKLIKRYQGKEFELFNLRNDPSEQTDVSGENQDKVKELNNKLMNWLEESKARLPKANPAYLAGKVATQN
jgi:arylsulfatase A-like enzyme